jgi:hypothetical protein
MQAPDFRLLIVLVLVFLIFEKQKTCLKARSPG